MSAVAEKWEVKPLGEIATLQRGYDLPVQSRREGKFPIFAANGTVGTHNELKVEGPGVITGRSGTIGKVHFVKDGYWPLNTSLYVKDFHGNHRKFIFYLLKQLRLERYCAGTGVPTLNRNLVHPLKIPLPPLSEQKRIADILDKTDAIRRKRQQAIEEAEAYLGSAFQEVFQSGESLPRIKLGHAEIKISDGNYSSKYPKSADFLSEGVPFIRANNLKNRTVIWDDMRFIAESQHAELRKGHLQNKDILIVTRGNIGEVGMVPPEFENANINAQLVLLRSTSDQFTPEFLLGYFSTPAVRAEVMRLQTGTSLKQLPVGQLVKLELPVPSKEDQAVFTTLFDKQQAMLKRLQAAEIESKQLFNSLVQRAFKGEL